MTDTQFYLLVGIPTLAVILAMSGNALLFCALSVRKRALDARMLSLETKTDSLLSGLEQHFDSLFRKI